MLIASISIIIAFLIGSIPSGYVIGRCYGIDIRQHGSGNIGATNIKRILGKKAGALTLVLDIFKGIIAIILLSFLVKTLTSTTNLASLSPLLGLAAIVGHCYSPFLGFNGGKGVATTFGVFTILAPYSTLTAALVFIIIQKTTSFVSLGSLCAAIAFPIATYFLYPLSRETFWVGIVAAAIITWRHKSNIQRLFNKEELKPS